MFRRCCIDRRPRAPKDCYGTPGSGVTKPAETGLMIKIIIPDPPEPKTSLCTKLETLQCSQLRCARSCIKHTKIAPPGPRRRCGRGQTGGGEALCGSICVGYLSGGAGKLLEACGWCPATPHRLDILGPGPRANGPVHEDGHTPPCTDWNI